MNRDTLLNNHGIVLLYLWQNPTATQRGIARAVGITEAHCGMIIRDLIKQGILRASKEGTHNVYRVNDDAHLSHPLLSRVSVGSFTQLLATAEDSA